MSKPVQVWRVVKEDRANSAFDGEGAFRFGGRWNNRGQRVVYASSTVALALLEILVHIDPTAHTPKLIAIPVQIPAIQIVTGTYRSPKNMSEGLPWSLWETRRAGDAWVSSGESLAMKVPSAIIPIEQNYLMNPEHPDFKECRIGSAQELPLDPRLLPS